MYIVIEGYTGVIRDYLGDRWNKGGGSREGCREAYAVCRFF